MCVATHLLAVVLDVPDLPPGEGDLGREPIIKLIDVQAKGVHTQPELGPLLILEWNGDTTI